MRKHIINFNGPTNLSSFGIHVAPKFYLGLEEFNFCRILLEHKVAYVPAFSYNQARFDGQVLHLYYLNKYDGCTYHYATMYGVKRIPDDVDQVIKIRKRLQTAGIVDYVFDNETFRQVYGEHFQAAFNIWEKLFLSQNNITASNTDPRFTFNITYDKIDILKEPIRTNWNNFKRANNLYDMPADINSILSILD